MATTNQILLTKYSHGAGCGCKIAPSVLEEILSSSDVMPHFPSLLVGNSDKDDAAVYQINDTEAIVSTTDFFMPIVNDPFTFGKIAAANAISDVYAMGGNPLMALAILGWPVNKLPVETAKTVLEGAKTICAEVGIPLAGGHSIDTPEPIFGLAVTGKVQIKHLKQNNKAQVGDYLFLTKPIGIGILSTAEKREVIEKEDKAVLYNYLTQLNKLGEDLGKLEIVHAMTDVTGFGLAGHLTEMASGTQLSIELFYNAVPKIAGIEKYLNQNVIPDATYRNWKSFESKIQFENNENILEAFKLLPDPQTNGGLLFSVGEKDVTQIQSFLKEKGFSAFVQPIGQFVPQKEHLIIVK